MKKYLYFTLALLISPPLHAARHGPDLRASLLTPLFQALQAGNIAAIEALMGGDLLKEKRVLLRKNKAYPKFLRHYYQGATFEVSQVSAEAGKGTVEVTVTFPNGQRQTLFLRLAQKHPVSPGKTVGRPASPGKLVNNFANPWKIVGYQSQEQDP